MIAKILNTIFVGTSLSLLLFILLIFAITEPI